MPGPARPVVFIHGLWLHATSWEPWVDLFHGAGYDPVAPGWPGDMPTVEESRQNSDGIAGHGIDDVVSHYAQIIGTLDAKPIVIGHSFGGTIAEKLLGQNLGAAAVAIDAAPIKGVLSLPISSLRSAFPVLKNPANKDRAVSLTAEQFHYAFGNAISETESAELHARWTIPAPGKPLFQAAAANFSPHSEAAVDTDRSDRGPLLLIAGGKDHTVPEAITRSTLKQYHHSTAVTDLEEFPDRGHSLTIDSGWRQVADTVLSWLKKQSL
jgi:pimeloyl-ACP methyl ester carboxylesterase